MKALRGAQASLLSVLGNRAADAAPEARMLFGDLACVQLAVGDITEFPEPRDFAYCEYVDGEVPRIVVSPRLAEQDRGRVLGVLAHEYGHAAMFLVGQIEHEEREADAAVRALFGLTIRYDDGDVQTVDPRTPSRPRPDYLG